MDFAAAAPVVVAGGLSLLSLARKLRAPGGGALLIGVGEAARRLVFLEPVEASEESLVSREREPRFAMGGTCIPPRA